MHQLKLGFLLKAAVVLILIGGIAVIITKRIENRVQSIEGVEFIRINGIDVPLIFEQSSLLPIGTITFVFNGGGNLYDNSTDSEHTKAGLSYLTSLLLNEGTKQLGSTEFAKKLESKAIDLDIGQGLQTLSFDLSFLTEYKDFAYSCLLELLSDPNLSEQTLNKVKTLAKTSLLAKESDFDYIADKNLHSLFFAGTAMASPSQGHLESIENISLSDIKAFLEQNLVLSRLIIVAGGDMELNAFKNQLEQTLSILPKGSPTKKPKITTLQTPQTTIIHKPTEQAFIYFATPFDADTKDNYKTKIMSFTLGSSGFGSRLMEEVRVKQGLAYSVSFRLNGASKLAHYGWGYLQTGLDSKDNAITTLQEVIKEFVQNGITQAELDSAKAFILGSEPLGEETLSQRLNAKLINYLRDLPLDTHKQDIAKISSLGLDEINAFIKQHKEITNISFSIVQAKAQD